MKTSILSIALAVGFAAAQLENVPACAVPCVTEYMSGTKMGGCSQFDIKCICSNANFLSGIACCLKTACNEEDQKKTVTFAKQICSTAGVQVPDEVVCNKPGVALTASSATSSADATGTETTVSVSTETTTESPSTETDQPAAAPAMLGPLGGLLGAAMVLAL